MNLIDSNFSTQQAENSQALLVSLIDSFCTDGPAAMSDVKNAIHSGTPRKPGTTVRSLQNIIENFTAENPFELMRNFETIGNKKELHKLKKSLLQLNRTITILQAELNQLNL